MNASIQFILFIYLLNLTYQYPFHRVERAAKYNVTSSDSTHQYISKRDVSLCTNDYKKVQLKLNILLVIRKCSLYSFVIALIMCLLSRMFNEFNYKANLRQNNILHHELDNIRASIVYLKKMTPK